MPAQNGHLTKRDDPKAPGRGLVLRLRSHVSKFIFKKIVSKFVFESYQIVSKFVFESKIVSKILYFNEKLCSVSDRLGGAAVGGAKKNIGHVSSTPQLGLQTGGAGHNFGTPGGDALKIANDMSSLIGTRE